MKFQRKLFSMVLVVSMLASMLPAQIFTAQAATGVEYKRVQPEVAILNLKTGTEGGSVVKNIKDVAGMDRKPTDNVKHLRKFNAVDMGLFKLDGNGETMNTTNTYSNKKRFTFNFENTVIGKISQKNIYETKDGISSVTNANIEAMFTTTAYNHEHKHDLTWPYTTTTYSCAYIYFAILGSNPYIENHFYGKKQKETTFPKFSSGFQGVSSRRSGDAIISVSQANNDTYTCKCENYYITDTMTIFRDQLVPKVLRLQWSENGTNWKSNTETEAFKEGETIQFRLFFDEPIRFADDSASGKENIKIKLKYDGVAESGQYATITKLEDQYLYFNYTVAENQNNQLIGFDFSELNKESNLKHVYRNENFDLVDKKNNKMTGEGYDKAKGVITDISGNPATVSYDGSLNLTFDTVDPTITAISRNVNGTQTNNGDIKLWLGKDPEDEDYNDASDIWLGAGDTLALDLEFSEDTTMTIDALLNWVPENVIVTTNIMTSGGKYATIKGISKTAGSATSNNSIWTTGKLTIEDGMTLQNSDGTPADKLEITDIDIPENDLIDIAGNKVVFDNENITLTGSTNIDATAPVITLNNTLETITISDEPYITPSIIDGGFAFGVDIVEEASGYAGLPITMKLYNSDDETYAYDCYIKSGSFEKPTEEEWAKKTSAVQGEEIKVSAVGAGTTMYFYIKPDANNTSNTKSSLYLGFSAMDYAGNKTKETTYKLNWGKDTKAPEIIAGEVTRDVTKGVGVSVTAFDNFLLNQVRYQWTDTDTEPADWASAGSLYLSSDSNLQRTKTNTAYRAVGEDEKYSGYLWVKAIDKEGNETVTNLGQYGYDRSHADVTFSYSNIVTDVPYLAVSNMGDIDDKAFVMIPVPNEENVVFGRYIEDASETNLFATSEASNWKKYSVTDNLYGGYDLIELENSDTPFFYNSYSGQLNVTLIKGTTAAFDIESSAVVVGTSTQTVVKEDVVLKVLNDNQDAFTTDKVSVEALDEKAANIDTDYDYDYDTGNKDAEILSTASGLKFKVTLPTKADLESLGYAFDSIDWSKARLELRKAYYDTTVQNTSSPLIPKDDEYTIPKANLANAAEQTVTIEAGDYESGAYAPCVIIPFKQITGVDGVEGVKELKFYEMASASPLIQIDTSIPDASKISLGSISVYSESVSTSTDEVFYGYDTAENRADYGLSEITKDGKYEREIAADGNVIYLPTYTNKPNEVEYVLHFDFELGGTGENLDSYEINDGNSKKTLVYNRVRTQVWNTALTEDPALISGNLTTDSVFMYTAYWETSAEFALKNPTAGSPVMRVYDSIDEFKSSADSSLVLPLIADQDNVIAVRMQNMAGKTSDIKKYVIHPVKTVTWNNSAAYTDYFGATVDGIANGDGWDVVSGAEIKLTPKAEYADDFANMKLYAVGTQYANGVSSERVEMALAQDGSYTFEAMAGNREYRFVAIDSYGGMNLFSDKLYLCLDDEAPTVAAQAQSNGNGTYTATFTVDDNRLENNISLALSLGDSYKEAIGAEGDKVLSFDDIDTSETRFNSVSPTTLWEATEANDHGIYKVEATMNNSGSFVLTAYGMTGNSNGVQPEIGLTAVDYSGNSGEASAQTTDATYGLTITGDVYNGAFYNHQQNPISAKKFRVTSSAPIKPADSWICETEPQYSAAGYDGYESKAQLPVINDEEIAVEYFDIFGDRHSDTRAWSDGGYGDAGVHITLSDAYNAVQKVTLTAQAANEGLFVALSKQVPWSEQGAFSETMVIDSSIIHDIEDNGTYYVLVLNKVSEGQYSLVQCVPVYIDNIAVGEPTATPMFYIDYLGTYFDEDQLIEMIAENGRTLESNGSIKVSYEADREVFPTNNSAVEYMFTVGGPTSYTFTFEDNFGNSGSLAVNLADYGITLTPAPGEIEVIPDTTAPGINGDILVKNNGSYVGTASFGGANTFDNGMNEAGYSQSFKIMLKVDETDLYKAIIKSTDASVTYDNATSDTVNGVTIVGNMIEITRGADGFVIIVVDKSGNKSSVTVSKAIIDAWLDNTPPEIETVTDATSLYSRNIYVRLTDKNDAGNDTASGKFLSPLVGLDYVTDTNDAHYGWYKYSINTNGSYSFVFRDGAGNTDTKNIGIEGIDTSVPKLALTWSPGNITEDGEGNEVLDTSRPPSVPVNKAVTASITSSVPLKKLTVEITNPDNDTENHVISLGPDATGITQESYRGSNDYIDVNFNADGGSVTFKTERSWNVKVSVVAMNGNSAENEFTFAGNIIDLTAPTLVVTKAPVVRTGFTAPISYNITIEPSEDVYNMADATDADGNIKYHTQSTPYTFSMTSNGKKTVTLSDKAGNTKQAIVEITDIDNVAPVITVAEDNGEITSGSKTLNGTLSEAGEVTCDNQSVTIAKGSGNAFTVTVTENGIFHLIAKDTAGNESDTLIRIGSLDNTPPSITFEPSTLQIREGSTEAELKSLLDIGYKALDSSEKPVTVTYDLSSLNKDADGKLIAGVVQVPYTATDYVGNKITETRYVRVFDKNQPTLVLTNNENGETEEIVTQLNGIAVASAGKEYSLSVVGLKKIFTDIDEPYRITAVKGLRSLGLMKVISNPLAISNEKVTFEAGHYTILIQTQSRQFYRTVIYAQ